MHSTNRHTIPKTGVCERSIVMWNAERDACDDCWTCEYFLHEFWNCQGDTKKCDEYIVARMKGADTNCTE